MSRRAAMALSMLALATACGSGSDAADAGVVCACESRGLVVTWSYAVSQCPIFEFHLSVETATGTTGEPLCGAPTIGEITTGGTQAFAWPAGTQDGDVVTIRLTGSGDALAEASAEVPVVAHPTMCVTVPIRPDCHWGLDAGTPDATAGDAGR